MKLKYKIALGTGAILYGAALKYYYDFCFKRPSKSSKINPDSLYEYLNQQATKYVDTLSYTDVEITSFDGLKLKGYYFNQNSKQTIVLVHGYHSNGLREYAQYIQFLYSLKMNLLVIDQRSHGQSEGKWIDFGYNERFDLLKWSQMIQENYPCDDLFYMGISMGAATVLMASGENLVKYKVKGIIADCGYDTLKHEVMHCIKLKHLPTLPFYYPLDFVHKIKEGHSIEEVSPIEQVRKTSVPILFIHGTEDHFVPTNCVYSLYKACPVYKELYLVKDAEHAASHMLENEEYERRVASFIDKVTEKN